MKKAILLFLSVTLLFSCSVNSSGNERIVMEAQGDVRIEERIIGDFTEVIVGGPIDLVLTQGRGTGLSIETYESILDMFVTEVHEGTLYLYIKDTSRESDYTFRYNDDELPTNILSAGQIRWGNEKRVLKITLDVNELKAVAMVGDVDLNTADEIIQDELELSIVGESDIKMSVKATHFSVEVAGALDADLSGEVRVFDVDCAGMGTFDALEMIADTVIMDIAGVGRSRVYARNSLNVDVAGLGRVYYKGSPQDISIDKAGIGKIQRINE